MQIDYKLFKSMCPKKIIYLFMIISSFNIYSDEVNSNKNIFIINSQHHLSESIKPAVDKQVEAIYCEYPNAEFFLYYLDNDRFDDSTYNILSDKLNLEVQEYSPDLVIVNGYDAYFYVMDRRSEIFKGVPIVFSGITDLHGRIPIIPEGITGIPDIIEVKGNIEIALQLQPKTENLYIILDRRISNRETLPSYLQDAIEFYKTKLNLIILKNPSIDELEIIISNADTHSVALMYPIITNSSIDFKNKSNPYKKVTEQSNVPIYSFYEFSKDVGVVGGYISSTATYGKLSGSFALRVLNGERPSEIKIPESEFQELILDYKVLKKYNISLKNIPDEAIIINGPFEFYTENKNIVIISFAIFLILLTIIVTLVISLFWRRKVQFEIIKLKSYLSNIINSMPSVIVGVDKNKNILLWNEAATRETGISEVTAVGKLFEEILPEYKSELTKISSAIDSRISLSVVNREHKIDNKIHFENLTIFPLVTNGIEGAVLRIDDVTLEKERQEKLNHRSRMDSIGSVSAGIAHDFNNMLGGITGAIQVILSSEDSLSKRNINLLELVLSSAFKSAELTKKLLVFSRTKKIDSTASDINEILDDTIEILNRTLDKRIVISIDKSATKTTIIGDNSSLQNTFMNLGINASHSISGEGKLSFSTSNEILDEAFCNNSDFDITPGDYIVVKVEDTGCGIPPEILSRIFEPFFTTKTEEKGTGLGLSTAYGTLKEHNGSITVESQLDKGTSFTLHIPCNSDVKISKESESKLEGGQETILLVDDDNIIRVTGSYSLQEMGYTVTTCKNGKEALTFYKKNYESIDVVIMDMMMPIMSGRDCFYKMREIKPDCKVIISSGFSSSETLKQMIDDGLAGFIAKPFKDKELSSILSKVIKS